MFVLLKNFLLHGNATGRPKKVSSPPATSSASQDNRGAEAAGQDVEKGPEPEVRYAASSSTAAAESDDTTPAKERKTYTPGTFSNAFACLFSLSLLLSFFGQKLSAVRRFRPTPRMISDAIIGLADGMTVPFALTAGLSTLGDTHIVQLGGIAEVVAGMISMGVGGALGAKAEADGYKAKLANTARLVLKSSVEAVAMVHDTLAPYGIELEQRNAIVEQLLKSSDRMVDWLMRFHLQEKQPDPSRPLTCGITIGLGYALGGLIPLIPYFCVKRDEVLLALYASIGVMAVALFVFGYSKTYFLAEQPQDKTQRKMCAGGLWMVFIAGSATAIAVGVVIGINKSIQPTE
ncbi:MAG: hypothetical protein Q9174_002193 [Haloplaca sp. 1 TL-2023]